MEKDSIYETGVTITFHTPIIWKWMLTVKRTVLQ